MTVSWMTRVCRLVACASAVIVVILISSVGFAQNETTTPKWDLFAGYQYLHPGGTVPESTSNPSNPTALNLPDMAKGIGGALTYNLDPHWGAEVDTGYNRDTNSASSEWTLSFGPRFMWRTEDANFFLHGLASFNRLTYDSGFATITASGRSWVAVWICRSPRSSRGGSLKRITSGQAIISPIMRLRSFLRCGVQHSKACDFGPAL